MQPMRSFPSLTMGCLALACATLAADPAVTPTPGTERPMKSARELIHQQAPPIVASDLLEKTTSDNSRLVLNLATQRACLMLGEQVCIDSPMSSGKRTGPTPTGKFAILEKEKDHRSSTYGNFVDRNGRVVRSGISMKVDSAPSGTHYVGTPMKYFCRLTESGLGIHAGSLPGYPSSHGGIRLPEDMAKLFFARVKVGTPVEIRAE